MGVSVRYPAEHEAFLARCRQAGQTRPTPLLLRYGEGDYNCLHQDVYGEHLFPLQVAILLSEPGRDFAGGEFVLTEQRPRMQSRAEVVSLSQGDGVIFAVRERPAQGTRGTVSRHHASRGEPAAERPALHPWRHLPRRRVGRGRRPRPAGSTTSPAKRALRWSAGRPIYGGESREPWGPVMSAHRQPAIFVPHGGGPCFWMDWPPPFGPHGWDSLRDYLAGVVKSLPGAAESVPGRHRALGGRQADGQRQPEAGDAVRLLRLSRAHL